MVKARLLALRHGLGDTLGLARRGGGEDGSVVLTHWE